MYGKVLEEVRDGLKESLIHFLKEQAGKEESVALRCCVDILLEKRGQEVLKVLIEKPEDFSVLSKALRKLGLPALEELKRYFDYRRGAEQKLVREARVARSLGSRKNVSKEDFEGVEPWSPRGERVSTSAIAKTITPEHRPRDEFLDKIARAEQLSVSELAKEWDKLWGDEDFLKNYENFDERLATFFVLEELLREIGSVHVLDLGSGACSPLLEALSNKKHVYTVALDPSFNALRELKKRYEVDCLVAAAPFLPLRRCTFDCVVASNVLHNFYRTQKPAILLSIDAVLKHKGSLISTEPRAKLEGFEETRQYLESMGYEVEVDFKKVRWKEKQPTYLLLLQAKKGDADLSLKNRKWLAKFYLKEEYVVKAMQLHSNLNELIDELEHQERLSVLKPLPEPTPPTYRDTLKEVYDELLRGYSEKFSEIFSKLKEQLSKILSGEKLEIAYELFKRICMKGELKREDAELVRLLYNKKEKEWKGVIREINWKFFDAGMIVSIHEGKYGFGEVRELLELPFWPLLSVEELEKLGGLEKEAQEWAKRRYREVLARYKEEYKKWRETNLLHI